MLPYAVHVTSLVLGACIIHRTLSLFNRVGKNIVLSLVSEISMIYKKKSRPTKALIGLFTVQHNLEQ